MQLTLLKRDVVHTRILPDKKTGQYWVCQMTESGTEDKVIGVEGIGGNWILKPNKNIAILAPDGSYLKDQLVEPMCIFQLHFKESNERATLFSEPITDDRKTFTKLMLPRQGNITIGRLDSCDIHFSNRYTSSNHAVITVSEGLLRLKDQNSANGTFVNGRRITEQDLHPGDVIYIFGLKLIVGCKFIAINNPDGKVNINRNVFGTFVKQQVSGENTEEWEEDAVTGVLAFHRSPRFKRDIEKRLIKIDPPPASGGIEQTPLMLMLGPSITMGMASLSMGAFTLSNVLSSGGRVMNAMPTLAMSFSMLLGTVLWPVMTRRYESRQRLKREVLRKDKYQAYIRRIRGEIDETARHQSGIMHENCVTLSDCVERIESADRKMWERTRAQNDFLKIRLGLGNLPIAAEIRYPEKKFTLDDDELLDELHHVAEMPKLLENVPITLSLTDNWVSGIIGDRKQVAQLASSLIVQLSALHGYDELKLAFIYHPREQHIWEFVKWLPHVWLQDKGIRLIATDADDVRELSAHLDNEIAKRKSASSDDADKPAPHYVIFAMDKTLASKADAINQLMKEKTNCGFSVIHFYDDLINLPKECSLVVEYASELSKIYEKNDITGQYVAFKPDVLHMPDAKPLAIKLANIELDAASSTTRLPDKLTFLELFDVGKVEHLNAPTRWQENDPTLSLRAPIGVDAAGEAIHLDLHEKFHGPHGLIAGMTGSGKSEFIMTFILSLAVNYHPYEVAFILIDYKGGGMANAFSKLPHLAGTITNLDGSAVNRSLVSIQSELKRRQAIFKEIGERLDISNLDIYKYQKLFREGLADEPLQHLFIISDEFAELKTQQPEFMAQLVSAARIGRSLGIHLILATQKPSGVVDDQIWSNSKFRICLRVQERADSMDVIKRPDAAELTTTGRFFIQAGFNELFELGQSAWAGAPYVPSDRPAKRKDEQITVIDRFGRVIRQASIERKLPDAEKLVQIDEINKYLAQIAHEENIRVKPLWLEPLPAIIELDELRETYADIRPERFNLNPLIGEVDDPENQRRFALTFPLSRDGNVALFGAAGSGDTQFLTTLVYALISEHTPDEVHLYLLDFGAETLRAFKHAPHVGDVMFAPDEEKIGNLLKALNKELKRRKQLFSDHGGDYRSYIHQTTDRLPAITIVVHNFPAFTELYGQFEDEFAYLVREGQKCGLLFVITAQNPGTIKYRMMQNIGQIYALQLNDATDYAGLLGYVGNVIPAKHPGKGIYKSDRAYEFQIAHIGRAAETVNELIKNYCLEYRAKWQGKSAEPIRVMPKQLEIGYFLAETREQHKAFIPAGLSCSNLQAVYFEYARSFIQFILAQSDVYAPIAQGMAEALAEWANTELVVLDPGGRFSFHDAGSPTYRHLSQPEQLEQAVEELFHELVFRNNTFKDTVAAGQSPPEFSRLTYLLCAYSELAASLSADGKNKLQTLLEKGQSEYNVNLLICDQSPAMYTYSQENWFKFNADFKNGVWVGDGLDGQLHFKLERRLTDPYKKIGSLHGYVLRNGKPVHARLLTSVHSEVEDDE